MTYKVFCYGTLRQGQGNYHRYLTEAKFLGNATTAPQFTMLHLGGFPGVVQGGSTSIVGEVFEVDDATLRNLDRLEGHPGFYERTPIILDDEHGNNVDAEIYLLPSRWLGDARCAEIPSGDWMNR